MTIIMCIASAFSGCPRQSILLMLAALSLTTFALTLVQLHPALSSISTMRSTVRRPLAVNLYQQPGSTTPPPTAPIQRKTLSAIEIRKKREKLEKHCFLERDYGMIPAIRESNRTYCDTAHGIDPALGALSTYTQYDSRHASIRSTVITNLWVDLRNAKVFKPIQNFSQDGHLHDPRFQHTSVRSYCVCETTQDQSVANAVKVWELLHGDHPLASGQAWQNCQAINTTHEIEALRSGISSTPWNKSMISTDGLAMDSDTGLVSPEPAGWPYPVRYIKTNAIILGRRDDHNPFFQIAAALNAWIMMRVLEWSPETTQLVYFDDGLPASADDLQRRILSPLHPVLKGRDLIGSVVHFDRAVVAPFEVSGPLMRHLDGDEPCRRNQLIQDFRNLVMAKYGVDRVKRDPTSCTITVISRRPYAGRILQRKWLNEDAILARMQIDYEQKPGFYKYGTCRVQAIDFVGLSLAQQMQVIVESDVILGMHGAGMVNMLWARPETTVTEIFPHKRKRYGYRNLCFFIGCKWFEFRLGTDTGAGDNASDKIISYADWFAFFDPIVRTAVRTLEMRVASSVRRRDDTHVSDY